MLLALFILLLIIAIVLYISDKKIISSIIFFFFLFDSFQLIPEEWVGLKTLDLAIIYICVLFIYGLFQYDNYIPINKTILAISLFLGFICFEMLLSHYYYSIGWGEIIRTGRQHILLLSYFVFRKVNRQELDIILKVLFIIVIFESFLFTIQMFTGIGILNGKEVYAKVGSLYRFYNISLMHYFFVFYAIFYNPFKGFWKHITMLIVVITIFFPMHRSLDMTFVVLLILGILWKKKVFNSAKKIAITCSCFFLLLIVASAYISVRTMEDINKVAAGDFQVFEDIQASSEATFLFRVGHFYERYTTVLENTVSKWFGLGFMTEGSSYTENHFDFIIGLDSKEGGIEQVNTPDISWSILIIRYGIVGTLLFIIFYFYFVGYYVQYRNKSTINMVMVLYLLLIFSNSLTSDLLYKMNMLIFPLIYMNQYEEEIS